MAIVKGIEEGAVLLKYKKIERRNRRVNNQLEWYDAETYYLLKLYSRRARTNGVSIEYSWMIPFMKAIGVRINKYWFDNATNTQYYLAVGAHTARVSKETWEQTELDPIAEKYYKIRLNNLSVSKSVLINDVSRFTQENIDRAFSLPPIEEDTGQLTWPNEPPLGRFIAYNLELANPMRFVRR